MKKIIFFLGMLLTFSNLTAQKKVTETKRSSGIDEVFVHVKFADNIEIKNWNKNEISVQASVNINDNQHNDYFRLKGDKDGGTYTIKSDYGTFFKDHACNYYNRKSKNNNKDNCKTEMDINYVIYVPRNMSLKVKSISGGVVADSYVGNLNLDLISGNIDIKKHSKNMKLKTISGDIDIYVSDATFEAKTLSGGIYSDLKIDFDKKNKYSGSRRIKATIKNGNATLKLSTISGDIFLRKS
tara:strand:- start:50498 stop:51217 length:720 start_codon:yes stop_codon:yes gene_type:complete